MNQHGNGHILNRAQRRVDMPGMPMNRPNVGLDPSDIRLQRAKFVRLGLPFFGEILGMDGSYSIAMNDFPGVEKGEIINILAMTLLPSMEVAVLLYSPKFSVNLTGAPEEIKLGYERKKVKEFEPKAEPKEVEGEAEASL